MILSFSAAAQHSYIKTYYDVYEKILKEEFYVLKKTPAIKDSTYISYYQNGQKKSEGKFRKNKAEGYWRFYYENGHIKMEGNMLLGEKNGIWKYYYENGNISTEGETVAGKKNGAWKFYFENGLLRSEGLYENDQKQGAWSYYFEDGILKGMANYTDDSGDYMELYPSGKIKASGRIENGKSTGKWTYYHEDGSILAEGEETGGLKNGLWKFYYPNGQLASEGLYENGKAVGAWKYYHDNGVVSAEGNMNNGDKDGSWKIYYKSGQYKGETNYVNGEGEYREYYESGRLRAEGKIINDKNEGVWKYYLETGEIEGTCNYVRGRGLYKGFYENGNLKMEGYLENGNKVGQWTLYNEDGTIAGYYKTFYENQAPIIHSDSTAQVIAKTDTIKPSDKPKLIVPKKKSRYFTPRVNEFKGFIVSSNPLYVLAASFPISVEYYMQERLGYEFGGIYYHKPFFKNHEKVSTGSVYFTAGELYVRQKFYQKDKEYGMLYFAHELRYGYYQYGNHYIDVFAGATSPVTLMMYQQRFEYSVLVGDRLLRDQRKNCWTIDAYIGVGVGYRQTDKSWNESVHPTYSRAFSAVNTSSVAFPFRFGLTVGYKFPLKK